MAPPFIACTDIGMSPCPVMKMIGSSLFAAASSRWKSRPPFPGNLTSSTRQVRIVVDDQDRGLCVRHRSYPD